MSCSRERWLGRMLLQPILDGIDERAAAFAADRCDTEHRTLPVERFHESRHARLTLFGWNQVQLVQHQPAWLVVKRLVVALELLQDRTRVGDRIDFSVERREVDHVEQQTRSLQMAQKPMPEACTFRCALDQSRNVGDDEAAVLVDANHPQMWLHRSKGIVCHPWARGRYRTYQRRLPCIGHSEKSNVGKHLELELEQTLLTNLAGRGLTRSTVGARLEMKIAQTALTTLGEQCALAVERKVRNEFTAGCVGDDSANRHAQNQVSRAASVLVSATPVLAALGAVDARIPIVDQGIDVTIRDRVDAPAAAAVPAVRPAARHVLLASE